MATTAAGKASSVATKRFSLLNEVKCKLVTAKDDLLYKQGKRLAAENDLEEERKARDELEKIQTIRTEIKRERRIGRRGAQTWSVHIILLICELLVNGMSPSTVTPNIQTTYAIMNSCEAKELPSLDFVRKCQTVVENLNLMFAGLRLGNATTWHELYTDGTARRQIAFQNLVIGLKQNKKFDSVIASSCIFLKNETATKQVEAITNKVRAFSRLLSVSRCMLTSKSCLHNPPPVGRFKENAAEVA